MNKLRHIMIVLGLSAGTLAPMQAAQAMGIPGIGGVQMAQTLRIARSYFSYAIHAAVRAGIPFATRQMALLGGAAFITSFGGDPTVFTAALQDALNAEELLNEGL